MAPDSIIERIGCIYNNRETLSNNVVGVKHLDPAHLSVEVVRETGHKLTLYRLLTGEQGEVVRELVVTRDDRTLPKLVKLWSTSSSEDLQHIQNSQVNKSAFLGIVDLCAL